MILLRALSRLAALLVLAALALAGLASALSCISGGTGALSLPWLAHTAHLPALRDTIGRFLVTLEAPGGVAVIAALSGVGAMLLGAMLIAGVLVPRRERRVTLRDDGDAGSIDARRSLLGHASLALAEQAPGFAAAKVRVKPRRRPGGIVRVRAELPRTAQADEVKRAIEQALTPVTEPFKLRAREQTRLGRRGSRVR